MIATNPNGNATLADGSITSSYVDIASAHDCTQLPFIGIGSAYRKVISAYDKLVSVHGATWSLYIENVSVYGEMISTYGEIVSKEGSITSAHERMASPYGEIKPKTISITSPYGLFTSPYRNTVSLPGTLFKSYDDGTPAYGKMANSYFFTINLYWCNFKWK